MHVISVLEVCDYFINTSIRRAGFCLVLLRRNGMICCHVIDCHFSFALGFVNHILAWPAFIPLSRLTYGAYLIHPMVLSLYFSSLQVPFHYTDLFIVSIRTPFTTLVTTSVYLEDCLVWYSLLFFVLLQAFNYVAITVLSYAAAFILAIGIEYPIIHLDKKIFNSK